MANTPDWLKDRSAAIPMIIDNEGVKIVLVTTKSGKNWIFPKGQIELGMTAYDSAAKEAYEEAGIQGQIQNTLIDEYTFAKWGGQMNVKVFPMKVNHILDQWPEMRERQRKIVLLDEAINLIQEAQRPSLIKFKEMFQTTI